MKSFRSFSLQLALMGSILLSGTAAHAQDAVDTASTWNGVRYLYGGDSQSGIDCSALARRAFRPLQRELPRTASAQWHYTANSRLTRSQLERNDLVFFTTDGSGGVTHVGVYIGGGRFWDANSVRGVTIDNIDDSYWRPRFLGGGRVLPNATDGSQVLLRPWAGNAPKWTYFMAYNGGGGTVAANSPNPWAWETWRMYVNGGGPVRNGSWVCLQANNGQYLSTDGSWKPATANRNGVAGWEWFRVVRENGDGVVRSGDRIALQGWQGPYLGANFNYGDWAVGCWYGFGGFGGWETMTLVVK